MKSAAVTRLCADLCFLCSLSCLFSPSTPPLRLLGCFLAACLLSGALAVRSERRSLRIALLLPPLAALAFAPDTPVIVALGIGWLFFALPLAFDRAGAEYWFYRRSFLVMAAAELLISLYVTAAKTLSVVTPGGVLLFGAAFLLLGLHTLRSLRMGAAVDPAWTVWSLAELLVPCLIGGAAFVLLGLLLRHIGPVLEALFLPVALLILLFTWLFGLVTPQDFKMTGQRIDEVVPPEQLDAAESAPGPQISLPPGTELQIDVPPFPWRGALLGIAVLAVLVLLALLLLRGRRTGNAHSALLQEERLRPFRGRRAHMAPRDDAERVRQCYRRYLAYLELHGRPVRASDTSADVLSSAGAGTSPAEAKLRQLYLRARYGAPAGVSAVDAAAAEACLREIKDQFSE